MNEIKLTISKTIEKISSFSLPSSSVGGEMSDNIFSLDKRFARGAVTEESWGCGILHQLKWRAKEAMTQMNGNKEDKTSDDNFLKGFSRLPSSCFARAGLSAQACQSYQVPRPHRLSWWYHPGPCRGEEACR